jgi:hypothetical protein
MIYNDGYAPIAGERHPAIFGSRAQEYWYELWPLLGPLIKDVRNGESIYSEDQMLTMHRYGYVEVPSSQTANSGNVFHMVIRPDTR